MVSTPAGTSEYDRFGPWIDEVRTTQDVPRLYRDHPIDLGAARLVLKVPRNIARRDATPDMDLYDQLLVVDDTGLTVLSRRGQPESSGRSSSTPGGYDTHQIPFQDVAAVRDTVDLLDGRMTVHTRTGDEVTVRYNGSAQASVRRLMDELRAAAASTTPSAVGLGLLHAVARLGRAPADLDLGRQDLSLVSDFRDASRHLDELAPWAWHGRIRVARRASGAAARIGEMLLDALASTTLQGIVLAGDTVALEVFSRHDWLLRSTKPVHSSSRLMMPLSAPDRLTVTAHPRYEGVVVATLTADASSFELLVREGSGAHLLLDAVAKSAGRGDPGARRG
jgi:hypothetical protein